jgi:hypothetical protein
MSARDGRGARRAWPGRRGAAGLARPPRRGRGGRGARPARALAALVALAGSLPALSYPAQAQAEAQPTHAPPRGEPTPSATSGLEDNPPAPLATEAGALARPRWLGVASAGTPLVGVEVRARLWAPVEVALAAELIDLDAALRAVGRVSWFPVRGATFELGVELGAGGAVGLRSASTLDTEVGLRGRARLAPRVDGELRLSLLGYLGPTAAETGLVGAPRLRLGWWVTDGFMVGAEGGALLGWSSAAPVAGLFVAWAPAP